MINPDILIRQLTEEIKKNFLLKGGCCYGFLDISTRQEELIFNNDLFPYKEDFYLSKESYFFIKKALYNALFLKNENELAFNLSQSTAYVSITIRTINRHLCDCSHDGGHRYGESMHEIVPLLSMPILTNECTIGVR